MEPRLSADRVKELVRERDGYACTKCGMTDEQHRATYNQTLQVHRVVPGSDYSLAGCVTVCQVCHGPLPRRPRSGVKKAQRPGVTGVYVELPDEQVAALDALIERLPLGGRADHIRLALARHLAAPPSVHVPEVPVANVPQPAPAPKESRGKKP